MADKTEINEPEVDEQNPNQKKQAKMYITVVISVLVIALIADTFMRSGNSKDKKSEEAPTYERGSTTGGDADDFERRLAEERAKLRNAKPLEEPPKKTLARLRKDQQQIEQPQATQPKVSIYKEFMDAEKRRALKARRGPLRLKTVSGSNGLPPSFQKPSVAGPMKMNQKTLEVEKQRVMKEIQRLQNMQNNPSSPQNLNVGLPAYMQTASDQNKTTPVSSDKIASNDIGQPASKGEPEPGQRLIPTTMVIDAVLDQTLMSDYAGSYRGMITHDVYDVTRTYIMIPKGSRFLGQCLRIANINEPIQARMGLTVKWIVLPNGKRINLEKSAGVLDQEGIHAVEDKVNYHFVAQFLGVAAYAVLSSETSRNGTGIAQDLTYEGQVGESMREQFAPVAAKYLSLVPTITLRAGTPIKIFLEDDVYAHVWSSLSNRLIKANRATY